MVDLIAENSGSNEIERTFNVSRESLEKLQIYTELLVKWQNKINLVGPKEASRIWSRHIADALQLIPYLPVNTNIAADFGSGAGIPGVIVAAALGPDFHIHLVESNGKKAAFLREVVRKLGISAEVHCQRIESLNNESWAGDVDVIFARALAPLPKLLKLANPLLKKSGELLLLKGLDVDSELTQTTKCWNITYEKYPSRTYAGGCILSIKDFQRVASPNLSTEL